MDAGNHGWFVVGLAVAGAFAFGGSLPASNLWLGACAAGTGGGAVAVSLHDRRDIQYALSGSHISLVQAMQSFVRVGWGLNVAIVAAVIMTLAGLALIFIDRLVARKPALSS
jgi:hypothetical protein